MKKSQLAVATAISFLAAAKMFFSDTPTHIAQPLTASDPNDKGNNVNPLDNKKDYILVSTDGTSNPYKGDTSTSEKHGLLCIKKENLPEPDEVIKPGVTDGGALKDSLSGSSVFVVPRVVGNQLTSKAEADRRCNNYGQKQYRVSGFRMAEFHDGDKRSGRQPGWSFWGVAYQAARRDVEGFNDRLWVSINDQSANPWGNYNESSNGQARKALTFIIYKRKTGS
jgi:hypothetical protein